MATESTEDLWAVVIAGSKTFIGKMTDRGEAPINIASVLEELVDGMLLRFDTAYEIVGMHIPVRGPNGEPTISKQISSEPFLLSFEGSPIYLKADAISFFPQMKDGDKNRYKMLVAQAEKIATDARASAAGIVMMPTSKREVI